MKAFVSMCLILSILLLCQYVPVFSKLNNKPAPRLKCWILGQQKRIPFPVATCSYKIKDPVCYSKFIYYPMNGVTKKEAFHQELGCMERKDCVPGVYNATLSNEGFIYMQYKCCSTETCNRYINDTVPILKNPKKNCLQCPGCSNSDTKTPCTSVMTVNCHGKENTCVAYTGKLKTRSHTYRSHSFKGCATKKLCNLLTGVSEEEKETLEPQDKIEAKCSPPEVRD